MDEIIIIADRLAAEAISEARLAERAGKPEAAKWYRERAATLLRMTESAAYAERCQERAVAAS